MRGFLSLVVGIVFWAGGASAQVDMKAVWDSDPRIGAAAVNLRNVVGTVALALVAKEICSIGESDAWVRVLGAVDARYAFCLKQDARWVALKYGLEKEEADARSKGLPTTPGILLFVRAMAARGSRALDQGPSFCSNTPWKLMLSPETATTAEIEADKRVSPNGEIEKALSVMASVLSLGKNIEWIERPCDKEFWPPGFTLSK
jgi:hypothetical protein